VGGTHTRDTGEEDRNMLLYTCCEFQPDFLLPELRGVAPYLLRVQPGFCSQSYGVTYSLIIKVEPIYGLGGFWYKFVSITCKKFWLELLWLHFTSSISHQSCRVWFRGVQLVIYKQ
jgi:hypothetical protein